MDINLLIISEIANMQILAIMTKVLWYRAQRMNLPYAESIRSRMGNTCFLWKEGLSLSIILLLSSWDESMGVRLMAVRVETDTEMLCI